MYVVLVNGKLAQNANNLLFLFGITTKKHHLYGMPTREEIDYTSTRIKKIFRPDSDICLKMRKCRNVHCNAHYALPWDKTEKSDLSLKNVQSN